MRLAVLYRNRDYFQYDLDWRDAFLRQKRITVSAYAFRPLSPRQWRDLLTADVIILLYSVDLAHGGPQERLLRKALKYRRGKVVYFPRNEFKWFRSKREFISDINVDLVASQLPITAARYLYADLAPTISLPHALNLALFNRSRPFAKRDIFLGGRSTIYPAFLLDNDRNSLSQFVHDVKRAAARKRIDYSTQASKRLDRRAWAQFLNRCQFTVSSEAGTNYLDKDGQTQEEMEWYEATHKRVTVATLELIFGQKVKKMPSGKAISSRHFEAIGCGVCQVLLEGDYNGILLPGRHYLALKKDFSNKNIVIAQMSDEKLVSGIIDAAYELARTEHTIDKRIEQLFNELQTI